jgi:polyferredoxin
MESVILIMELTFLASLMILFSIFLIFRIKNDRSGTWLNFSLYLSGGMVAMFIFLPYYFSSPNLSLLAIILLVNTAYMIVGFFLIIYFSRFRESVKIHRKPVLDIFALLMGISEAAMGQTFNSIISGSPGNILQGTTSYWYQAAMLAEMLFALFYCMKKEKSPLKNYLIGMLTVMLIPPLMDLSSGFYVTFSTWYSAVTMIGATVLIYETLYRSRGSLTQNLPSAVWVMSIFALMMLGEFLFFLYGDWTLFELSMILGMALFIYKAMDTSQSAKIIYTSRAGWTFTFLLVTFVMEWLMGAVLDFNTGIFSGGVPGFISSLPWYAPLTSYYGLGAAADFIAVVGMVTGSPWFLIMMGTEMGSLVIFKMMSMKSRENIARSAIMLFSFAVYAIYLPIFSPFSSYLRYIPYMWSMGIGTLGPVSPSYLLGGIVGTYAVSAALSFMFGGRQICSVTCTAPVMYQGTFYDTLKTYNRTSRMGKKTLGSSVKPLFMLIIMGVWVLLLISAIVSYLNSTGIIAFTILDVDVTMFLFSFFFNFLWYVVFISIPFMGTYACITQGWCAWGSFNEFFGHLGLFKLKVSDSSLCSTCSTKECATACPVGNTELPGNFIRKGEFKSFKCVGVGDCIEACPHNNIFTYDVRAWVKEKIRGSHY